VLASGDPMLIVPNDMWAILAEEMTNAGMLCSSSEMMWGTCVT